MDIALEIPDLNQQILHLVSPIPRGKVTTFRALADALGDPIAARAVGLIVSQYRGRTDCPIHRVVQSDGSVFPDNEKKLVAEGIPVRAGRVQNLPRYSFTSFLCDRPLRHLRQLQDELRARISLRRDSIEYSTVGGIDLSYRGEEAVAAYVCHELPSLAQRAVHTHRQTVAFPYIPTYLAFRELPVMAALVERLKSTQQLADITLVDGSGILHQRHAGIASHLGVLLEVATIGVTKSLLCGQTEKPLAQLAAQDHCYILFNGERVGAVLRPTRTSDPIFISPGHRIDLESALEIVRRCLTDHRLPVPIQHAHDASRAAASQTRPETKEKSRQMPLEFC